MTAALIATAAALLLWPSAARPVDRLAPRCAQALDRAEAPADRPRSPGRATPSGRAPWPTVRRRTLAALAAAAVIAVGGGGPGALLAAAVAALAVEWALRRAWSLDTADVEVRRELPVACDLLAVCLAAGAPMGSALAEVARAVPGELGRQLGEVAALHRLGADARTAWARVPAGAAALARVLTRADETGSAVVPALHRLAVDARVAERNRVQAAVGRAGVWVLAPLGACFLPAFLCLGVVPMVLGVAADVLG